VKKNVFISLVYSFINVFTHFHFVFSFLTIFKFLLLNLYFLSSVLLILLLLLLLLLFVEFSLICVSALNVTFTSLNGVGAKGPTDILGYQGTILHEMVQLHNGIQIWRVPIRGTYTIKVLGASGGNGTNDTSSWRLGGLGAQMEGDFFLMEGTILKILVGHCGLCAPTGSRRPGGGGGGSFVALEDNKPLIIAGGGGGGAAPWIGFHHGDDAQITSNGSTYGGTQGTGGRLYDIYYKTYDRMYGAAAGGGLVTNGASGNFTPGGKSFINGGEGGVGKEFAQGGFGGGGAAYTYPGGGGGYSGGGVVRATRYTVAGGGGSYNGGTNKRNQAASHRGPGRVEIRLIQSNFDMM